MRWNKCSKRTSIQFRLSPRLWCSRWAKICQTVIGIGSHRYPIRRLIQHHWARRRRRSFLRPWTSIRCPKSTRQRRRSQRRNWGEFPWVQSSYRWWKRRGKEVSRLRKDSAPWWSPKWTTRRIEHARPLHFHLPRAARRYLSFLVTELQWHSKLACRGCQRQKCQDRRWRWRRVRSREHCKRMRKRSRSCPSFSFWAR